MRLARVLVATGSLIVIAASASANPPLEGEYSSTAGDILEGRGSESWPGGSDFEVGDALNLESWDGSELGTEWYIRCPAICDDPELLVDTVDGAGNGFQIWQSYYCGGVLWLNGDGGEPWSGGADEYVADIDVLIQITTIQFVAFEPVGWVTDLNMNGVFSEYGPSCIELFLANTERVGDTATGDFPAGYPDLVGGAECSAEDMGSAWDVEDITMSIIGPCVTPTENVTWGKIKNTYR